MDYCPSIFKSRKLLNIDFVTLRNLAPGFYHPKEKYNNTADVTGILNVKGTNDPKRLILFIQMKDWFQDELKNGKHIIDGWRWSQQFVSENDVYSARNSKETLKNSFPKYWEVNPNEICVFIIFSANKIKSISKTGAFSDVQFTQTTQSTNPQLERNEATMDLDHSKTWFPTFGYNLQAALLLLNLRLNISKQKEDVLDKENKDLSK